MRKELLLPLAVAGTLVAGQAAAQSVFGDTQLSYQNGVVYDDDLVPGRGLNQPFLVGEQNDRSTGGFSGGAVGNGVPQDSRNLIGADGRSVFDQRPARFQRNFFAD